MIIIISYVCWCSYPEQAVTLVVVTRSLMTARMTSVLMGVVTAVVTRWSRTLDGQGLWMVKDSGWSRTLTRERNWWFWKVAISTGILTTFFIAIRKNKYCYTTGETAGSPLTYTSIMLWPVALDSKITNYSVNKAAYQHNIESKDTLEYQTEYTKYSIIFVMYLFSYTKTIISFSVHKFITDCSVLNKPHPK